MSETATEVHLRMISERLTKIESERLTKIENKIDDLSAFKWKTIGALGTLSFIVTLLTMVLFDN